jgi:hypothetical protein
LVVASGQLSVQNLLSLMTETQSGFGKNFATATIGVAI